MSNLTDEELIAELEKRNLMDLSHLSSSVIAQEMIKRRVYRPKADHAAIRQDYMAGMPWAEIATKYKITERAVRRIVSGK